MRKLFWIAIAAIIIGGIASQIEGPVEPETSVAAVEQKPSDINRLNALGTTLVNTGAATEYDIAVWSGALDVTISSLLPGEARAIAEGVCTASQEQFGGQWERAWQLRIFILTSSDSPAAVCRL